MRIRRLILIILFISLAGCARATEVPPATPTPTEPIVGGDTDAHGCIPSAGYQWCESLEICYRTWETDCPIESPGGGQALPTLSPEPTPWVFPTPFWDNTNLKWPYGVTAMAIPIEATFGGPVKVYVLLGSDWMPHRDQDLTDTVMLVLVNTEDDTAEVISVARDLYVFIPGYGWGRINVAWSLGGFETVKETVRYNFGLEVDGVVYARINAVESFIDNGLGSLYVQVGEPIVERCGDLEINLLPGEVIMDGEYAICYARSRMMTSDFSRMVRQQEILDAMKKRFFERALDNPVELAEQLYRSFSYSGVKTDIPLLDVPSLVAVAIDIGENVDFHLIAPPLVEHFDHPESGAWLLQMPTPYNMYSYLIQVIVLD